MRGGTGLRLAKASPQAWLQARARDRGAEVSGDVKRIVEDVRLRGDAAVHEWTERLDGVKLADWRVPEPDLAAALGALDPDLREALRVAERRIRAFHEATRPPLRLEVIADGIAARLLREPLGRVAVYVPAGRWPLPSSLLMGAIPAQVAGVGEIVVLTPPRAGGAGLPADPVTLAAAALIGIRTVYLVGGAQAVAAAAFGTESLARADKLVGPGNQWVTEAKRQLQGVMGIDGLNGPSEVVIWGEPPASPVQVAHDLLAQAEHDPDSWAMLVSTRSSFVAAVEAALNAVGGDELLEQPGVGAVIMPGPAEAVRWINRFAPEHLELWGEAEEYADQLVTAGATFMGCPTPLGDYVAGPNHVLPTGGTARFASVLGVDDFLRRRTETRMVAPAPHVVGAGAALAKAEGLVRHEAALASFLEEAADVRQ
jgi:histidinol dehydrogenase